jgi:hypothetical protein
MYRVLIYLQVVVNLLYRLLIYCRWCYFSVQGVNLMYRVLIYLQGVNLFTGC